MASDCGRSITVIFAKLLFSQPQSAFQPDRLGGHPDGWWRNFQKLLELGNNVIDVRLGILMDRAGFIRLECQAGLLDLISIRLGRAEYVDGLILFIESNIERPV